MNYRAAEEDIRAIADTTLGEKVRNLSASIQTLKTIEAEGRLATPEEQAVLAKFPGWGWTQNLMHEANTSRQAKLLYREVTALLTDKELNNALKATLNSHYTDPKIIQAMWTAMDGFGFSGGRILEPSAGTGLFAAFQPTEMSGNSFWRMIEMDSLTGRVLSQLQQSSRVDVAPYESVRIPENAFDLAISNVPFGNISVRDAAFTRAGLAPLASRIHNYFFAKAMQQLRPGGIMAFITSAGTMNATDAVGVATRSFLNSQSNLIGAIRLPNNAFARNANTSVTTDIIFLQKHGPGVDDGLAQAWSNVVSVGKENGEDILINEYFQNHPEMVLGTHSMTGKMHAKAAEYTVKPLGDRPLIAQVQEAVARLPKGIYRPAEHPSSLVDEDATELAPQAEYSRSRGGTLSVKDGKIFSVDATTGRTVEVKGTDRDPAVIERYTAVRNALVDLFDAQRTPFDVDLGPLQSALTNAYDAFVKAHGPINKAANVKHYADDPDFDNLAALEKWDPSTKSVTGRADIFTKRVIRPTGQVESAGTSKDALIASFQNRNGVDLDYIASLTGKSPAEVADELGAQSLIFRDPVSGWVSADAYGSGNVRQKLAEATLAAKTDPSMAGNVEYLRSVQPVDLKPSQIRAKLGAPWVPQEMYEEFLTHLLGAENAPSWNRSKIQYSPFTVNWDVTNWPSGFDTNATVKWGTKRISAPKLLEHALNDTRPVVKDRAAPGEPLEVNAEETAAASAKLEQIIEEWHRWRMADGARANAFATLYNQTLNVYRDRVYDGSHLELPGSNPLITLRPHQKNAVWRTMQEQATLLAHDMGTGKTFTIIASAMELRRVGIRNKPMIVCHNSNFGAFVRDFRLLYPNAKALVADEDAFEPSERRQFMARAATGDWDAILIKHSSLVKIPVSPESAQRFFDDQITELRQAYTAAVDEHGERSFTAKQIGAALKRLEDQLEKQAEGLERRQDDNLYWEDLGIDHLFVDESHEFKNLMVTSSTPGMSHEGAQKTMDLFMKTNLVRENGGGLTFATGTPFTNSIAEIHSVMRYLVPDLLAAHGMQQFDAWRQTFAEVASKIEKTVAGTAKEKERLSTILNVPELMAMYKTFADPVPSSMVPALKLPPLIDREGNVTDRPIVVETHVNPAQLAYFKQAVQRYKNLKFPVEKGMDTAIKISTDNRHVSLDPRLRMPNAPDYADSKINKVVENVLWEYNQPDAMAGKYTQVIFCDLGVPGEGKNFDVYNDIKRKLVHAGVPADEIAFMNDYNDRTKQKLFDAMNDGRMRILLTSRQKGGVGVNIQKRLAAAHQVDPTWKPDLIRQSDKRIIRDGNTLAARGVRTYMYVAKGTFDEYMWKTTSRKSDMLDRITNGTEATRDVEDIEGDESFNFNQLVATASGNPEYIEMVNLEDKVKRMRLQQQAHSDALADVFNKYTDTKTRDIPLAEARLEQLAKIQAYNDAHPAPEPFGMKLDDQEFDKKKDAGEYIAMTGANMTPGMADHQIGEYRGYDLFVSRALSPQPIRYFVVRKAGAGGGFEVRKGNNQGTVMGSFTDEATAMQASRSYPTNEPITNLKIQAKEYGLVHGGQAQQKYFTVYDITPENAASVWNRINEAIDTEREASNLAARVENAKAELPKMLAESKVPFPKEAELKSAEARLAELKAKHLPAQGASSEGWGADLAEAASPQELEGIEAYVPPAPKVREAKLRPLTALKKPNIDKAWIKPNVVEPGNLVSDSNVLLSRDALKPNLDPAVTARMDNPGTISQDTVAKYLQTSAANSTIPVEFAGYQNEGKEAVGYFLDKVPVAGENEAVTAVDAHKLSLIAHSLEFDEVRRQPGSESKPLAFFKEGRPVGLLMPRGGGKLTDADVVRSMRPEPDGAPSPDAPQAKIKGRRKTERGAVIVPVGVIRDQIVHADRWLKDVSNSFKDAVLENGHFLQTYGSPETMAAFMQLASPQSAAAALIQTVGIEIHKLMQDADGFPGAIELIDESRLRGIRAKFQRFADMALDPDEEIAAPIRGMKDYGVRRDMVGGLFALGRQKERFPNVIDKEGQLVADTLAKRYNDIGDDAPLRKHVNQIFQSAADNVHTIPGLGIDPATGVDQFEERLKIPGVKEALALYKQYFEPVFRTIHMDAEGDMAAFATEEDLGPLGIYGPLFNVDEDGRVRGGFSNRYATGQGTEYDTSVKQLGYQMTRAIRRNALVDLLASAASDGIVKLDTPPVNASAGWMPAGVTETSTSNGGHSLTINIDGKDYPAVRIPLDRGKIVVDRDGRNGVPSGPTMAVVPKWFAGEVAPAVWQDLDWGRKGAAPSRLGKVTDFLEAGNLLGMKGPLDIAIHAHNIEGTLTAELLPAMGLADKVIGNTPVTKLLATNFKLARTDVLTPTRMQHVMLLGKFGALPERYGSETHDPWIATGTGSHYVPGVNPGERSARGHLERLKPLYREPVTTTTKTSGGVVSRTENKLRFAFPSLSPEVFGRTGLDVRARVLMLESGMIMAGMDPTKPWPVDPETGKYLYPDKLVKVIRFVNHIGPYARAWQSTITRALKDTGINPFAVASNTMNRNAFRNLLDWRAPEPGRGESFKNSFKYSKFMWGLMAGPVAFAAAWVMIYHAQTGRWPWDDADTPLFYTAPIASLGGQRINLAAVFSPMLDRAMSRTGLRGAYGAYVKDHDASARSKASEAVVKGGLNTALQTSMGPTAGALFKGATGTAPYVTGLYDPHTKRPGLSMLPLEAKSGPGMSGAASRFLVQGGLGLSGFGQKSAAALGIEPAVENERMQNVPKGERWLKAVGDLVAPSALVDTSYYNKPSGRRHGGLGGGIGGGGSSRSGIG